MSALAVRNRDDESISSEKISTELSSTPMSRNPWCIAWVEAAGNAVRNALRPCTKSRWSYSASTVFRAGAPSVNSNRPSRALHLHRASTTRPTPPQPHLSSLNPLPAVVGRCTTAVVESQPTSIRSRAHHQDSCDSSGIRRRPSDRRAAHAETIDVLGPSIGRRASARLIGGVDRRHRRSIASRPWRRRPVDRRAERHTDGTDCGACRWTASASRTCGRS